MADYYLSAVNTSDKLGDIFDSGNKSNESRPRDRTESNISINSNDFASFMNANLDQRGRGNSLGGFGDFENVFGMSDFNLDQNDYEGIGLEVCMEALI